MKAFRLYTQSGCEGCESAKQFLTKNKIGFEEIVVGFDKVVLAGLAAVLGPNAPVPLLISFFTQEMISGFAEDAYEKVLEKYRLTLGG